VTGAGSDTGSQTVTYRFRKTNKMLSGRRFKRDAIQSVDTKAALDSDCLGAPVRLFFGELFTPFG